MAVETLYGLPAVIESGNTIRFRDDLGASFPPATWTAKLYIGLDTPWEVVATTSGTGFLFVITATESADFTPGRYPWTMYVFDVGGERTLAKEGVIRIMPNRAAVREPTVAEGLLAAIEEALLELNADPDAVVDFNGQSRTAADRQQMNKIRDGLQAEVISEQRERLMLAGGEDPNIINVRYA